MAQTVLKAKVPVYLRNVGRSMGYTVSDVLAQYNPTITNIKRNSKGSIKYVMNSISDMKRNEVSQDTRNFTKNPEDDNMLTNLLDDLKTGNWYNTERIGDNALAGYDDDSMYDPDDEDWGDSSKPRANQIAPDRSNTKSTINAIVSSNEASAKAIGYSSAKSAEYIVKANSRANKAIYDMTSRGFNQVSSILLDMDRKLDGVLALSEPLAYHLTNSAVFYTKTTQSLNKIADDLDILVRRTGFMDMNNRNRVSGPSRKGSAAYTVGNQFDLKGYLDMVAKNLHDETSILKDALGIVDEKKKEVSGGLMKQILVGAIDAIIPQFTKDAMMEFNQMINNTIIGFLHKGGKQLRDSKNPIAVLLGRTLFPQDNFKRGVDTSNYNKGPIQWDGIAKKSLTEVIPTYLAKIYAAVGGEERYYDYQSGRFVKIRQIQNRLNYEDQRHANAAGKDLREEVKTRTKGSDDAYKIQQEVDNYLLEAYRNPDGDFRNIRANKNNPAFLRKYGLSKESMDLLIKILDDTKTTGSNAYKSKGKNVYSNLSAGVYGERHARDREYARREAQGTTIDNYVANGFTNSINKANKSTIQYMADIYQMVGNIYVAMSSGRKRGRGKVQNIFDPKTGSATYANQARNRSNVDDDEDFQIDDVPELFGMAEHKADAKIEADEAYDVYHKKLKKEGKDFVDQVHNKIGKDSQSEAKAKKAAKKAKDIRDIINVPFEYATIALNKLTDGMNALFWGDGDRPGLLDRVGEGFDKIYDNLKEKLSDKLAEMLGDKVKTTFKDKVSNLWAATKKEGASIGSKIKSGIGRLGETWQDIEDIRRASHPELFDVDGTTAEEGSHYRGARQIQNTGLAVLSKGEMVIPSEMNPYYHGSTNKNYEARSEARIRDQFLGTFSDGNYKQPGDVTQTVDKNGNVLYWQYYTGKQGRLVRRKISKIKYLKIKGYDALGIQKGIKDGANQAKDIAQNGINTISQSDAGNFVISGVNSLFHGAKDFMEQALFGDKKEQKKQKEKLSENLKKAMGEIDNGKGAMVIGAGVGAGLSLLTGAVVGPLAGAAIGAGVGLVAKSKTAQDFLFGEGDPNSPEYKQGLLKGFGKFAKQNKEAFGAAGIGAGVGAVGGAFLGSPVMGAFLGGALGFATKSKGVQDFIFGKDILDENGNRIGRQGGMIPKSIQDSIKKKFPNMAAGILAGAALAPGGLVTKLLVGTTLGYVSTTDAFHTFMFGDKEKGKMGLADTIHEKIIGNLDDIFHNFGNQMKGFWSKLSKKAEDLFKGFGSRVKKIFDESVKQHPVLNKIASGLVAINPINVAGKALDFVNTGTKKRNLRKGYDVYDRKLGRNMTAAERVAYRDANGIKNGNYGEFDRRLADMNNVEDVDDLRAQIESLNNRKSDFKSGLGDYLNQNVSTQIMQITRDPKVTNRIVKAIQKGDQDKVDTIVAKLPADQQAQLQPIIQEANAKFDEEYEGFVGKNAKLQGLIKSGIIKRGTNLTTLLDSIDSEKANKFTDTFIEQNKENEEKDDTLGFLAHIDAVVSNMGHLDSYESKGKYKGAVTKAAKEAGKEEKNNPHQNYDDAAAQVNGSNQIPGTGKQAMITEDGVIQTTTNNQGEPVIDESDSETKETLKKREEYRNNIGKIGGISAALGSFGGILGSIKTGLFGDKEDNSGGLFSTLFSGLFGEDSALSGILSLITGKTGSVGTIIKSIKANPTALLQGVFANVIGPGLLIAGLGGAFDSAASTLTGDAYNEKSSSDSTTYQVTTTDGKTVNATKDENGNYVDANGNKLSVKSISNVKSGRSSFSDMLKYNTVRNTVTGTASVASKVLGKTAIGKAITGSNVTKDIANTLKSSGDDFAELALQGSLTESLTKVATKISPVLAKFGIEPETTNSMFAKLSTNIANKLSSEGAKNLAKVASNAVVVARIAFAVVDFTTGYQDARTTLGITAEPTTGQRILSGLVRLIKNLIPIVGTLIPDSLVIDVFCDFLAPALGIDVDVLKGERDAAQAEVDEYNAENGTNYSVGDYNKQVLGDYTWTEKIGNAAKKAGSNIKNAASNAVNAVKEKGLGGAIAAGAGKALSSIGGGIKKVATSIDDITGFTALMKFAAQGDIKGYLTYDGNSDDEEDESGIGSIIKKIPLLFTKISMLPKALVIAAGANIIKGIKKITSDGKEIVTAMQTSEKTGEEALANKSGFATFWNFDDIGISEDNTFHGIGKAAVITSRLFSFVPTVLKSVGNNIKDFFGKKIDAIKTDATSFAESIGNEKEATENTDIATLLSNFNWKASNDNILGGPMEYAHGLASVGAVGAGLLTMAGSGIKKFWTEKVDSIKTDATSFSQSIKAISNATDTADIATIAQNFWWKSSESNPLGGLMEFAHGFASIGAILGGIVNKFGDFLGGIWGSIKEKVGGTVDDVKTSASNAVNSAKNTVSTVATNVSNSVFNTVTGWANSGYNAVAGGGSGFVSQKDPSFSNQSFAGSTFGNKGCGPAVAAMAASANGKSLSVQNAISASKNYQNSDGVSADYFGSVLGSKGVSTTPISGSDTNAIYGNLAAGGNMILLGQDSNNTSKANSPFGPGNHYVLAKGLDSNGNVVVNDPELSRGNVSYDKSILNNVKLGLATGSGSKVGRMIRFISGGASGVRSDSTTQQIWAYLRTKLGMSEAAAAAVMGNMQQESGCVPDKSQTNGPAYGICQWEGTRKSKLLAQDNYQSLATQLAYLASELPSQPWSSSGSISDKDGRSYSYSGCSYDQFKQMTDVKTATIKFEAAFERAGKPMLAKRIDYASQYYKIFTGKDYEYSLGDAAITGVSTTSSSSSSSDSSSESTDPLSAVSSIFSKMFGFLTGDNDEDDGSEATTTDGSISGTATNVESASFTGTTPVEYMKSKLGKLHYSQKQRNVESGSSDCSGTVQWAVKKATGLDIGSYSGAQYNNGNLSTVWYNNGNTTDTFPTGLAQPNDILFFKRSGSKNTDGVGHVELYEGDGKSLSHGGPNYNDMGPKEHNVPGKLLKISRINTSGAGSNILDFNSYAQLCNGGSSGVLINSRVGSRSANARISMPSGNYNSARPYYGGASTVEDGVSNMINSIKSSTTGKGGAVSAELVSKLVESLANLLNTVADNTAPIEKIYEVLNTYIAGGGSGTSNDYTTTRSSSTRTKGVSNNSTMVVGSNAEIDSNLKSLAGVLAELAKG